MDEQKIVNSGISIVMTGLIADGKHANLEKFKEIRDIFIRAGIKILAPRSLDTIHDEDGFVTFFSGMTHATPKQLEDEFLRSINKADYLYVVNTLGHIQYRSAFEMHHAHAMQKPIITEHTRMHLLFNKDRAVNNLNLAIPYFAFDPTKLSATEKKDSLKIENSLRNMQATHVVFDALINPSN